MRWAALIGLIGLTAALALFIDRGIGDVFAIFAAAGSGVIVAAAFHLVPVLCNGRAWQILLPDQRRPGLLFFSWAALLREAVNTVLPVARIGGEVVGVHVLRERGVRTASAVGSLVADITLTQISMALFALLGLGLLLVGHGSSSMTMTITLGLLITVPLLVALVAVQRFGLFALLFRIVHALFGDRFEALAGGPHALDRKLRRIYRRRGAVLACGLWQLAGWILGAGELWLAARFMGHPIPVVDAVILEAVVQALGSAAFFVPGALGVQEGGFLLVGQLIGLPPHLALALALARRVRDLVIFVPAVLWFQMHQGHSWLRGLRKT